MMRIEDRGGVAKIEILFHSRANEQQFVVVYGDGRLVHLVKNDGYAFLKHGAGKRETAIALDDVAKLGGASLASQVRQAREMLRLHAWLPVTGTPPAASRLRQR
jgi:hypothetical protein